MKITIADMNERIRIERPAGTLNANGVLVPGWATVCEVWARASDMSGREWFAAGARQAEQITSFTIRWREGLDGAMRVIHRGAAYEIVRIDRMSRRKDYMTLNCRRAEGEGT